jgi:uncharacterized protein YkwD
MKIICVALLTILSITSSFAQNTKLPSSFENKIEQEIDKWRASNGLSKITWLDELDSVADICLQRTYAAGTMGKNHDHSTQVDLNFDDVLQILLSQSVYLASCHENLLLGYFEGLDEAKIPNAWSTSPGHRSNMAADEPDLVYFGTVRSVKMKDGRYVIALQLYGAVLQSN